MDQREMQIKQEMFSEHDERVKRYDAIWNKRLEHQNAMKLQEVINIFTMVLKYRQYSLLIFNFINH